MVGGPHLLPAADVHPPRGCRVQRRAYQWMQADTCRGAPIRGCMPIHAEARLSVDACRYTQRRAYPWMQADTSTADTADMHPPRWRPPRSSLRGLRAASWPWFCREDPSRPVSASWRSRDAVSRGEAGSDAASQGLRGPSRPVLTPLAARPRRPTRRRTAAAPLQVKIGAVEVRALSASESKGGARGRVCEGT